MRNCPASVLCMHLEPAPVEENVSVSAAALLSGNKIPFWPPVFKVVVRKYNVTVYWVVCNISEHKNLCVND